jgi:type IV secretion system protein VirB5
VRGSALLMNTYLRLALVSLLALGLLVLNFRTQAAAANLTPLVVRIDEVGRTEAVQYDASSYRPQAPEEPLCGVPPARALGVPA